MPTFFAKPENALKRANEFSDVGKKEQALQVLCDVMKAKRHHLFRIKIHEPIMMRFVELCVDLRQPMTAKEILHQYKNMVLQMNVKALDDVIKHYIRLAKERTEEARSRATAARTGSVSVLPALETIDDLDALQTPESLQLAAQAGADSSPASAPGSTQAAATAQTGTETSSSTSPSAPSAERTILMPWLRFLWESYRQCLDLLRNNAKLEPLYQQVAQEAFQFCMSYGRKTEFRKLCDALRLHLGQTMKYQGPNRAQHAIDLTVPESLAMHHETRIEQLNVAVKMELWLEALRAIEDIHGLISLSKKMPKPSLMANYYNRAGLVFWKSGSPLYHAAALHRLYQLHREQRKSMQASELQALSDRVIMASLAVPFVHNLALGQRSTLGGASVSPSGGLETLIEPELAPAEKHKKLAALLNMIIPPSRASLIQFILQQDILKYASSEVKNLFYLLESDLSDPLSLAGECKSALELLVHKFTKPSLPISEGVDPAAGTPASATAPSASDSVLALDLTIYLQRLQEVCAHVLLTQMSRMFTSFSLERFFELVPYMPRFALERLVVEAARTLELPVRIDHQNNCLRFVENLSVLSAPATSARETTLHKMDSMGTDQVMRLEEEESGSVLRTQLALLYHAVFESLSMLVASSPPSAEGSSSSTTQLFPCSEAARREREHTLAAAWRANEKRVHQQVLKRKHTIETRKEQLENLSKLKEKQELEREAAENRARKEEHERSRRAEVQLAEETQRVLAEQVARTNAEAQNNLYRGFKREAIENILRQKIGPEGAKQIMHSLTEEYLATVTIDELMSKGVTLIEKERRETFERLKRDEKKVDHFVRAKRLEEIPLMKAIHEAELQQERTEWEEREREKALAHRAEYERSIDLRRRLAAVQQDKEVFLEKILAAGREQFLSKHAAWKKEFEETKQERVEKRRSERKEQRREEYENRKQAEKERQERERSRIQQEKQRQKDMEVEERLRRGERGRFEREPPSRQQYDERDRDYDRDRRRGDERDGENRPRVGGDYAPRDRPPAGGSGSYRSSRPQNDRDERRRPDDFDRDRNWRGGDHRADERVPRDDRWQPPSSTQWREKEQRRDQRWAPPASLDRPSDRGLYGSDRDRDFPEHRDRDHDYPGHPSDRDRRDRDRPPQARDRIGDPRDQDRSHPGQDQGPSRDPNRNRFTELDREHDRDRDRNRDRDREHERPRDHERDRDMEQDRRLAPPTRGAGTYREEERDRYREHRDNRVPLRDREFRGTREDYDSRRSGAGQSDRDRHREDADSGFERGSGHPGSEHDRYGPGPRFGPHGQSGSFEGHRDRDHVLGGEREGERDRDRERVPKDREEHRDYRDRGDRERARFEGKSDRAREERWVPGHREPRAGEDEGEDEGGWQKVTRK